MLTDSDSQEATLGKPSIYRYLSISALALINQGTGLITQQGDTL